MYHGVLNVYKESGYTSFDVVAKLRGICGQKKIGHTGTLDPEAEGVLPVCLGKATKVCSMLTDSVKEYRAVMLLGVETDTQDTSGRILRKGDVSAVSEKQIRETVDSFVGKQEQIPPMYSALKVNGQKLCDLARKGQTVERKSREIEIYQINIERIELPRVQLLIECSKGTYIRTLCHDMGKKLGCHAAVEELLRTYTGGYRVEDSITLDEIQKMKDEGTLAEAIDPIEEVLCDYPAAQTLKSADRILYNGNALRMEQLLSETAEPFELDELMQIVEEDELPMAAVRVFDSNGTFCALYQYKEEKQNFCPEKMFL